MRQRDGARLRVIDQPEGAQAAEVVGVAGAGWRLVGEDGDVRLGDRLKAEDAERMQGVEDALHGARDLAIIRGDSHVGFMRRSPGSMRFGIGSMSWRLGIMRPCSPAEILKLRNKFF